MDDTLKTVEPHQEDAMKTTLRAASALLALILAITFFPVSPAEAASYSGTISKDKVFFRSRPNTDSIYYDLLKKGTKITITGVSGNFYKVEYNKKSGYVMKSMVNASSAAVKAFEKKAEPDVVSKYAKVRSISALGDPPKATRKGSYGDHVEKLQRALQIKGFLKGKLDGKYGNDTMDAVRRFQRSVKLKETGTADNTTILKLFGKAVAISAKDDPGMKGVTSISKIDVPNTTRPGNSGRHVRALQQALKLKGYYKANIDSSYGEQTVDAVKRFQRATGLTQDGIAGNSTIKKLFGKNAANHTIPTKKLDWFDGGKNVIPQWSSFVIKDVATGLTFSARRWSGYNHMDTEPLTKSDAATLKKIAGGSYSWARRAILVKYNGHVYAASMNTMPHGEQSITNNNYPGHFCVHFSGSRTHETNRQDGSHQSAVRRATGAEW